MPGFSLLESAPMNTSSSISITKAPFDINRFRTSGPGTIGNVETLLTGLPVHPISHAKDFVRLHPSDDYWSPELSFVNVPIVGAKKDQTHLIEEAIALRFLPSGVIKRARLALGTKPYDRHFLCLVPTQNLDNKYNEDNVKACLSAKTAWVQVTSRRDEDVEGYRIQYARDTDAFPEPKWTSQSLGEL